MKTILFLLLNLMLFIRFNIIASSDDSCGTVLREGVSQSYLPTTGNIKVLVIFAQFKDDTATENNGWTLNTYPSWANNYINSEPNGNYPWYNLSHYFNEMSNGTFQVIGDVYDSLVVTDSNQSYYSSIGQVNREIILKVDPYIDFSEYDILNGSSFGSDGIVDFIYIIYRNVMGNTLMYYTGIALLQVSETLNVDGKQIVNNTWIGGGVQQRGGFNGRDYTMYVSAHELGHYLLDAIHIDNVSNLALMTGGPVWNASRGMHSWERQRLGWITYTDKSNDGSVTMSDYMTADQVYRVPINSSEYFLIENRKKLSPHDYAGDNGFYFYRITGASYFAPTIDVLCADGNWNFDINTSAHTLTRTTPNVNGYDEMNFNQTVGGFKYTCRTPVYFENSAWGDSEDAFDLTFNNVLSPVSNPRSTNGGSINFSIEVTGTNTIQFYFTNPYAGKPSKPQNLKAIINAQHNTVLTWEGNIEPDVISGGRYKIYKAKTSGNPPSTYSLVAETTGPVTSWTDPEITLGNNTYKVFYKISAVDNTNKESVPSEYSWVNYISSDITASTTFGGNLIVERDLTIGSDAELTLLTGSLVRFAERANLTVSGTLIANGTSSNKVTFDFIEPDRDYSNGIKVNYWGSTSLSNAIIENAWIGVHIIPSSNPSSIQNSIIRYCNDGILIEYGGANAEVAIEQCDILNNLNFGIGIFNRFEGEVFSSPYISNNHIANCDYGIYLSGNIASLIEFCLIENCTYGLYCYNGQPSIRNNTVVNPQENGIYCNSSGKSPIFLDNTIIKEVNLYQGQGIWIENNTAAYIAHNDISGFAHGIYCGGGVNSYFGDYEFHDFYPNNRMRDNVFGFVAGWGSYIYAGKGMGDGCWNNSIYANKEYDVVSYEHSYIMAQYNYWGGGRPNAYVDQTSELYADEILERDPWGENKFLPNSPNNPISNEGGNSDIVKGIQLEKEGKINDAVKHYKQMISKNSYAGFALTELAKFKKKYSVTTLPSYFGTLVTSNSTHKEKVLRILAAIHLDENRYNEAMQVYSSIISQFPNSRNAMYARFEKYYAALNHASDLNTAFQLLQEIRSLGLTDDEFLMKLELAEHLYNSASGSQSLGKSSTQTVQSKTDQAIPNDFTLFYNYPNPFNPTTKISYALPFESEVSITIFDLTGRVIKTLNLYNQAAGNKAVMWDGKNDFGESVSSGVYICTFKAVSLEGNGKSFTKSKKLMLLK